MTLQLIVFIVLALFIAVCSVLAVTTSRILRAATYLLFVLFGTAGIYFQLNYSFLGAVQLLIYAGGITVLYVFSILLTSSQGDKAERLKNGKMANNVKKRVKVPASTPKRKQRMVCLMSEEEVRIVDCYLKKYKITNKARWLRETVLTFIHQKMEEDYPTLFNEHDMRR